MNLTFRNLEPRDSAKVASMISALAAHIDTEIDPQIDAEIINRFGPEGTGYFDGVVAEQGSQLVGMCLYSVCFSAWRGAPGVFVSDIYVDPSVRSRGLGGNLLREAARKGAARGCRFLQLDVDSENKAAIGFYTHLGMHGHANDIQMFMEPEEFSRFL